MKRIINRKIYDTETAELLHEWNNGRFGNDFRAKEESLYRTKKGNFFIAGSGGAMTEYAVSCGNNSTSGSSNIYVISKSEAINWLEEHDGDDVLLQYFKDEVEEA